MEVEEKVEEKVDNESSTCEKATNAVINPVEENMEIAEDDVSNLDDDGVSLEEKANFKLQNKDSTELVTDELDKIKDQVMHAVNEKSNFKLQNKETTELVTDVLDEIQNQVMQDVNENLNSQNKTDPVVANGLNDEPSQNIQENPTMQIHDEIENITSDIINSIIDKVEKEEKSFEELENNSVSQTSLGKHKEDNEDLGSPRSSKRKRVPKKMEFNELKKVESKPAPLIPVQEKIIVETPILWKLADLVWAYVPGHPVWPCMVTLHPEENVFTKMKGSNQRLYHMQFLGDSPERGWVSDLRVFPYTSPDDYGKIIADLAAKAKASKPNKSRFKGSKPANSKKIPRLEIPSRNKDDWDSAVVEIGEAVSCTAEERITKFGYDFKPFLQHLKKHLIDDKYYTLQELLVMDAEEVELENANHHNMNEEDYDLEVQGIKIKYLEDHRGTEINLGSEEINTAKNRIRIYLDPNQSSPTTTSASSQMKLSSKTVPSMLNVQTSKTQGIVNGSLSNQPLPGASAIPLPQFSNLSAASSSKNVKAHFEERKLTINFDEEDHDFTEGKNKNETFKELFRLVEKVSNDNMLGGGGVITHTQADKASNAIIEQPAPAKSNYYSMCSCNALDKSRGIGKCYTLRNLLDAVESVKSGVPASMVILNFNMPKSVLLDNVNGKQTLTIKHHSDCNLFQPGSAILIRGHVHHLKAIEEIRSLKLYKKENTQVSKKLKNIRGRKGWFAKSFLGNSKFQASAEEKRKKGRPKKIFKQRFQKKTTEDGTISDDSSTNNKVQSENAQNDVKPTTRNIDLHFSEKQLRNAFANCKRHYLVTDKKASFFTATQFQQTQIRRGLQCFMNNSNLPIEEVSSYFGLEPGFFAENIQFFARLSSKSDLSNYTLRDIIHAMDDILSLNQQIGRICFKLRIPDSTMRDCLKRNTDIYNSLVTPGMTRRERLEALFNNREKLRVSKRGGDFVSKWDESVNFNNELKEGKFKHFARGYYAEDFINALDDIVHRGGKVTKIARQYNIPSSTLRYCIFRNLPIYHELVDGNLTKKERLVILEKNISKFRFTAHKKVDLHTKLPYKFPRNMELERKSSIFLTNLFSAMDEILIKKKKSVEDVARKYKVSYKILKFHTQFSREQFESCVNDTMSELERLQSLLKNKEIFYLSSRVYGYDFESGTKSKKELLAQNVDTEPPPLVSQPSKPPALVSQPSKPPALETQPGPSSNSHIPRLEVSCSKEHIISALDYIIIGKQGRLWTSKKYNIPLDCISHVIPRNYSIFKSMDNIPRATRLKAFSKLAIDFGDLKFVNSDDKIDGSHCVENFSSDDELPLKSTTYTRDPGCKIKGKSVCKNNETKSSVVLRKSVRNNNTAGSSKPKNLSNIVTQPVNVSTHSIDNLVKAIDEVEQGSTVYKSANKYGIPAKKLLDYVSAKSAIKPKLRSYRNPLKSPETITISTDNDVSKNDGAGTSTTVSDNSENLCFDPATNAKIKKAVLSFVNWGWFINLENLKVLIKDIAEDKLNEEVSDDKLQSFCELHGITLTNIEDMIGKNKPSPSIIYNFFDNLEFVLKNFKLQDRPSHVYAIHCFTLKSCLKNRVTVVAPVNALGDHLAPLIIFEGKGVWCSGEKNKVFPGTQFALSSDGNLTHGIFIEWFNQFLDTVPQRPLLLLYDGSLNELPYCFLDNVRGTKVALLKYPYSTDLNNFYVPYGKVVKDAQQFYADKIKSRTSDYSQAEITTVVTEMWEECLTPDAILSGFDTSGVYPINRGKYPAETFSSAELHQYCLLQSKTTEPQGPTPAAVKPSTGKASKISCGAFLKNLKVKETSLKRMKRGSNITLQDLAKNLKYTNVKEHIKSLPKSQPRLNNAIILSMQSSCRKPVDDKVLQDAMFSSYCKKLRPTMAAQNPELTPEQIESLIWIEWEALSNEERLLHQESSDQTPSTSVPDAPKPRSRGRPRKLSPMPTNVVVTKKDKFPCSSCEENYPTMSSLEQHKRWCAGPRQNLANIQPLSHSSLSAQSNKVQSVKLSYKCNQCKDMFYSEVSLNVHEKYCTGGASEKSNKAKQQTPLPKTSTKKKASVSSTEAQDDCASTGSKEEELGLMKKTYFKGPQLGTAKRANICIICELVEDDLLTCTGGCLQSFHPACLKLEVAPPSTDDFVCDDCKNDSHPCSICHKRNTNEELGEIKRCNVPKCGRSYHVTCLHSRKLSIIAGDDEEKINKGDRFSLLNSQRCTLHQCATCASKGGDDNFNNTQTNINKKLMFRCLRCPTAYHSGDECIAAGSLILPGLNIICPEHFKPVKTIPHHQPVHVSCCFVCSKGGELVCCESCPAAFHPTCVELDNLPEGEWFCRDCQFRRRPLFGDIVWVKLGSYRWWPGEITHPNEIPDNIQRLQHGIGEFVVKFFGSNDFFWLNKRRVFAYQEGDKGATKTQSSRGISTVFNKAIKEAQARFEERSQHRQKLKEIKTQKKRPSYKHIKVNKPVGNVQVHVADQSEINRCICKRTDLHPCGPESECLNRMLMFECHPGCCPSGDKCENQRFQKRDYPSSEVFKTSWGGWGLRTKVDIKKGEFVNEYVGELVDSEECLRRIEHAHKNNVTNFYMLTIDKDRIIDAGPKGNYSRFMNHCCDPTCETQKWTINGDTRVGLFARNNLKGGDELTFNYNLDCLGNDKTPCMCGSQNCSGFIGVRPKPQINGQNGSRQKIKKKKRLEVRLVPKHDDFCFRCRDLGTLVCCDVRGCERAFCLSCLRLSKPPFGKWECPWHHCDFCGRRSQSFCHFCPNSFCGSHVRNQLFPSMPNKYDCCTDHDPKVAEYDMEEAISNAVQAMLPQEHWNDSLEVKEDSTPSPTLAGNSSNVKSSPLPQQPVVQKRGRPKKIVNGGTPDTTVKSNKEAIDSDSDDLVPLTSSPVKRKRAKKQNHKRNKRLKSTLVNKAKEAVIKSTDALAEISTTSNAGEVNLKPESI